MAKNSDYTNPPDKVSEQFLRDFAKKYSREFEKYQATRSVVDPLNAAKLGPENFKLTPEVAEEIKRRDNLEKETRNSSLRTDKSLISHLE